MSFNPINALSAAGNSLEDLSDEQRAAFMSLSEHEVEVLTAVQSRLNAAGNTEVEGQIDINLVRIG